jgi:hypothetical protein
LPAHQPLPRNKYTCFNAKETRYVNRDLFIRANREYVCKKGTGERLGRAGAFRHPSDPDKILFTSGYLSNGGWKATHSSDGGLPKVTLKRYVNGQSTVYRCSPQSGG